MAKAEKKPTEKDLKEYIENPMQSKCDVCGLKYDDFRTGETYDTVYESMWKASEDPTRWRNKNRHGVLGAWHEMKQSMWRDHLEQCEQGGGGSEPVDVDGSDFEEY